MSRPRTTCRRPSPPCRWCSTYGSEAVRGLTTPSGKQLQSKQRCSSAVGSRRPHSHHAHNLAPYIDQEDGVRAAAAAVAVRAVCVPQQRALQQALCQRGGVGRRVPEPAVTQLLHAPPPRGQQVKQLPPWQGEGQLGNEDHFTRLEQG